MMCIKKQSYKNITFLIISPQPSIVTFLRFYILLFIYFYNRSRFTKKRIIHFWLLPHSL